MHVLFFPLRHILMYLSPTAPTVISASPAPIIGGVITIFGTSFTNNASLITDVEVGDCQCTSVVLIVAHTTFTCVVPAQTAQDQDDQHISVYLFCCTFYFMLFFLYLTNPFI
jgi:IPT/TIG domain